MLRRKEYAVVVYTSIVVVVPPSSERCRACERLWGFRPRSATSSWQWGRDVPFVPDRLSSAFTTGLRSVALERSYETTAPERGLIMRDGAQR